MKYAGKHLMVADYVSPLLNDIPTSITEILVPALVIDDDGIKIVKDGIILTDFHKIEMVSSEIVIGLGSEGRYFFDLDYDMDSEVILWGTKEGKYYLRDSDYTKSTYWTTNIPGISFTPHINGHIRGDVYLPLRTNAYGGTKESMSLREEYYWGIAIPID